MANPVDQLIVEIRAETKQLRKGLNQVNKQLSQTGKKTKVAQNALKGFGAIVATLGVAKLASQTVATIRTFEDLEATLRAVTGSAANAAMSFDLIRKFTATTTFQVEEVADAFIRLKQAGVTPTSAVLLDFGNLAAGMGRSITQLSQAAFNATTGEMEMLKQFGIIARIDGDKIRATFNGITTEIGRSGDEVIQFLRSIGREEFPTAISERANTLTGAISNLMDSVSEFFVAIGEGGLKDALTQLAKQFKKVLDDSRPLANAIGKVLGGVFTILGNIIMLVIDNLALLVSALAGMAAAGAVAGVVAVINTIRKMKAAIDLATMSSVMFQSVTLGPVGIAKVAVGVTAATASFVMLKNKMDETVGVTEDATDEMDKLNQEILDAMPMNAKHIDKVSDATRKLIQVLNGLKPGAMNLNEVLLFGGGDLDKFMTKIKRDVFKSFQQIQFPKNTASGQKSNLMQLLFSSERGPDFDAELKKLAEDMSLTMDDVFGEGKLFENMADFQKQAGAMLVGNLDAIFHDLFKMDEKTLRESFMQILDIPQVSSLMGGVQKILRDSLGSELDGIKKLLNDDIKFEAFFKTAQAQGFFLGFTMEQARTALTAYKNEAEDIPDPFENLSGLDQLFFDTLEEATEGAKVFTDELKGMTEDEILEKLREMPDLLAKFGFAAAEDALPHITKLKDSLTEMKDVLEDLHGDFGNMEEVLEFLRAAMADGNISLEQANALYREFLESLGPTGQAMAKIGSEIEGIADSFAEDFTNALLTGEDALESFRNFAQNIVQSIISEFLRLLVIRPIVDAALSAFSLGTGTTTNSGGGGGMGFAASGGRVQSGKPYMVGERGAELFIPDGTGVIKNHMDSKNMTGGTPIVVNQNISFSTGIVPTVRHEVTKMLPQIADVTKAAVAEEAARGGNFGRILGGR